MNKSEDVGLASSRPSDDELTRKEVPHLHFLFGLMASISFYAEAYSIPSGPWLFEVTLMFPSSQRDLCTYINSIFFQDKWVIDYKH